jgi:Apea-like HEPN
LKYLSVLRCRTYFNWPEHIKLSSREFTIPVQRATSTVDITAKLLLATYEGRREDHTSPSTDRPSFGPRIWRGKINTGYILGNSSFIKSPEDELPIAFHYDDAKPGEIDIIVIINSQANISESVARNIAEPISYNFISYIAFSSGDIIIPTAPFQILRVVGPGKYQLESSVTMSVRHHRTVEAQEIRSIMQKFLQQRSGISSEEAVYLYVASRRFLTAIDETDPIDKFCDFWEACEFLSKNARGKGSGMVDARIAMTLSNHTGKKKADLENRITDPIYRIRKDIVHNAIENPDEIEMKLLLLEEVTRELIKYKLGISYTGNDSIDRALVYP